MLAKLLWRARFLALRSKTELKRATPPARMKRRDPKMYPSLLMVKGMARMPEPMTVLMTVVVVRMKSFCCERYLTWCPMPRKRRRYPQHFSLR